MDNPLFLKKIVDWLRAGYPDGVPQADYIPLVALLAMGGERAQMAYARALADWGDVGGYDYETQVWDEVTLAALGVPFEKAQFRAVNTLSGGEQKRLVLEALLR